MSLHRDSVFSWKRLEKSSEFELRRSRCLHNKTSRKHLRFLAQIPFYRSNTEMKNKKTGKNVKMHLIKTKVKKLCDNNICLHKAYVCAILCVTNTADIIFSLPSCCFCLSLNANITSDCTASGIVCGCVENVLNMYRVRRNFPTLTITIAFPPFAIPSNCLLIE